MVTVNEVKIGRKPTANEIKVGHNITFPVKKFGITENNVYLCHRYNSFVAGMKHKTNEITINNPSRELMDLVDKLRERKHSQLEKLRSREKCTFSVRL